MTISFGFFLMMLINVLIFLKLSSILASLNKTKACLFAVLALIFSIIPWIKSPNNLDIDNNSSSYYQSY